MESLKAKILIKGTIKLLTGLHIGGSSSTIEIGGLEHNVIKTHEGIPYIPGSSLKGKLRTLLAIKGGHAKPSEDSEELRRIFGDAPDSKEKDKAYFRTRLICRDAFLRTESVLESDLMETEYTEVKWENTIDRATSEAKPRQIERVPEGAQFDAEFIYDVYDQADVTNLKFLLQSFKLLEDDYLGGSGTRGYGRIAFSDLTYQIRQMNEYEKGEFKGNLEAFTSENISEIKV